MDNDSLKKLKKETLLDLIENLREALNSGSDNIYESSYNDLQETLDEHQEFIKELKEKNNELYNEIDLLTKEIENLQEKNRILFGFCVIMILLSTVITLIFAL